MPIYEYGCSNCGVIEAFQRITDDPLTRCPNCKRKVTKLISRSSFRLKGSGWYVTDYGDKGRGAAADSKDGASTADEAPASEGASKSAGHADGAGAAAKKPAGSNGANGGAAGSGGSGTKKDARASKSSAGSEAA